MRQLARLVLLGGALALGLYLFRAAPRDVTLVYDFGRAPPHALSVEIAKDGRTVRRAEFRFPSGAPGQVVHRVRLTDGVYTVRLRWGGSGAEPGVLGGGAGGIGGRAADVDDCEAGGPSCAAGHSLERRVTVEESGTIVLAVER